MHKVTIIGTGSVGSTIAYTMTINGLASEIVMIDINAEKVVGEALDIKQGLPFCSPCSIYAGSYADSVGSDIVIITSGVPRKPGQSRLDLAQTNVDVLKSIIPEITKYAPDASYVLVSNPVDILTYVFTKLSGIPEDRILGSGTILDTARLRARLAEYYSVNQHNVHACVLGEHGDSSFIPWSVANISNVPIQSYSASMKNVKISYPPIDHDEVEEYVRKSGARVIERKGATYYAVSISVCHLCRCLLSSVDTTLTVSTMLHGEYGIDDVCLSLMTSLGRKSVTGKLILPLNYEERLALKRSSDSLKSVIAQIKI